MSYQYDLLLKNGTVVDPVNNRHEICDVGLQNGRIAELGPDLDPGQALESFDLSGHHVIPGIIDLHVHVSSWLGGRFGHKMMARAGVTTALDMSGPVDSVLEMAASHGAGLNLACLQYVRPEATVKTTDPSRDELEKLLENSRAKGAYGFKILGGHYPLTPEATALTITVARENGAYLAFHAGSTASRSNLDGFDEAIELIGGHRVHLAHINSYCRGRVKPYLEETEHAIEALEANPHICSEAYLSPFNGTSARCSGGKPQSQVTVMCLEAGSYPASEEGLQQAILEGWAHINQESGGEVVLATGPGAVDYWHRMETGVTVSFPVNPAMPRLRLASAKRDDNEFVVDCISTDGGGIPRNVIVPMGLALVELGVLSLEEFVLKTSRNPAKILGLENKGHLGPGADADVTVLNLASHSPDMAVANGQVIMYQGHVCGSGCRLITTPQGEAAARKHGLDALVIDQTRTPVHQRPGLTS
jgi:cytosine/adenosine deaminase-related metal-dependent hydrolase